jgi:hypothetical protein
LTLVIKSLEDRPHNSIKNVVDAMISPTTPGTMETTERTPSELSPSFDPSQEPTEDTPATSAVNYPEGIICPHLEYFTILSLDPKLSTNDITLLKQATEIQAMRVAEARRNNGVFIGARIGWHEAFVQYEFAHMISETKKWGLEWKAFI